MLMMICFIVLFGAFTGTYSDVYAETQYTVTFHANHEDAYYSDGKEVQELFEAGQVVEWEKYLSDSCVYNEPYKPHHSQNIFFKGWATSPDAVTPEKNIVVNNNLDVYAVWNKGYKVSFHPNYSLAYFLEYLGGDDTDTTNLDWKWYEKGSIVTGYSEDKIILRSTVRNEEGGPVLSDDGHINGYPTSTDEGFLGWSTNPQATKPDKEIIVLEDMDVYAVWEIGNSERILDYEEYIRSEEKKAAKNNQTSATLSKSKITNIKKSYNYTGKAIQPKPVITLNNKKLKLNTDYTITYKNNKKVGLAKLIIKGKKIKGTKTVTFKIVPKGTNIVKIKRAKKGFEIRWKKNLKQTTGYQIQYSMSKQFKKAKTVTVSRNKTVSKRIKKLRGNKKYYVRVRTYKTVKGKKYYSAWSERRSVKTK